MLRSGAIPKDQIPNLGLVEQICDPKDQIPKKYNPRTSFWYSWKSLCAQKTNTIPWLIENEFE